VILDQFLRTTDMSTLTLDAEALYTELRAGVQQLWRPGMALMGIWSGGAWLAERLRPTCRQRWRWASPA
jgi:hypothetical protein